MPFLPSYIRCICNTNIDRKTLITRYYEQGYTNVEILTFLYVQHNIQISLSTLKSSLSSIGLRRWIPESSEDRDEISEEIRNQLAGSGYVLGKATVL